MTQATRIVSAAVVDENGVSNSAGQMFTWADLGMNPTLRLCPWPRALGPDSEKFRRMDLLSRSVLLSAEAAGVRELIDAELRPNTAVVSASSLGCIDSDIRFAAGLKAGGEIEPAVFSYTLSSTCLGELAIRHGLTGPSYAFSTPLGREGEGLLEACALLDTCEASAAVVCLGDAVSPDTARAIGVEPRWRIATFVILRESTLPAWLSFDDIRRGDLMSHVASRLGRKGGSA